MTWSWKIGQVAGTGVSMHATFLLSVGRVARLERMPDGSRDQLMRRWAGAAPRQE